MKNRTLIYFLLVSGGALAIAACKKSFLDVKPQGTQLESDYYKTPDEVFNGITAAYSPLTWTTVSSYCPKMVVFNAASDDTYAGGGSSTDNPGIQALDNSPV